VVHTGVKSAGCENNTTHFPAKSCGNLISHFVDGATNSGANSPIRGILVVSIFSIFFI